MFEIKEKEAKIIVKTKDGITYKNSSTAYDIKEAKELVDRLQKQINIFAKQYEFLDPLSMEYRYGIGNLIFVLAHEEGVTSEIRKYFIKEIEEMTSVETLIGKPLGKGESSSRHPYLITCYWLRSNYSKDQVLSLNWSTWSDIFDRPKVRNDNRIVKWIIANQKQRKLSREIIREILKYMTYFVEKHDLSFLEETEVFEEMDKANGFEKSWNQLFDKYFQGKEENLSPARKKNKSKYKEKYLRRCYEETLFVNAEESDKTVNNIFVDLYVNV